MPSRPIPPVVYGESSGTVAFPDSVLMIGAPRISATASSCSRACRAPAPARIATLSPALSTSASRCRSASAGRPGASSRIGAVDGGPGRADLRVRVLAGLGDLEVVGQGQVRHPAPGVGGAYRDVHHRGQLRRVVDHLVVDGDVGVELVEVHFLLIAGAQHRGFLHAGDREHRHVIELGVVEAVEQVDAAGAGRGQADADLPGRLGVGGRHERGGLLVVDQHELHPVLMAAEALHDPVDAVARDPEDGVHAPVCEPLDQSLGCDLCHLRTSS